MSVCLSIIYLPMSLFKDNQSCFPYSLRNKKGSKNIPQGLSFHCSMCIGRSNIEIRFGSVCVIAQLPP